MNESSDQELNDNASEPKEAKPIDMILDKSKIEDSPEKARETTRSEIAKFYVWAFFGVILITFIIGLLKCFEAKDYKDMLITVSGILSGPLGFIIGYYFKTASSKEN